MKYTKIREEELKNKVGADWFRDFDTTEIIGNIDFSVFPAMGSLFGRTPLLWAEAKTGDYDIATMFVQLILTIGKARTFDKTLPPAFLGAFDFKKIAFVPYIAVQDIFYLNDFNWNVTPSNHQTKEFLLIKDRINKSLERGSFVFDYEKDEKELKFFIRNNIAGAKTSAKIKIDKNNFIPIYLRWLEIIKPQIDINEKDWEKLKKDGIIDADFYLADLFVDDRNTQNIEDDISIRESLFVIYQNQGYKISKENLKAMFDATISIRNKDTYQAFWKIYKRPPIKEYQEYIIERRDLLVPQDIRERKGAFFTPRQWVELSQKYLADVFGENWQDEYYVWDCAAGTGNLLAGLTNKYNIYASTLDQADVNVMHERIEHGANLLKSHCFQFDFLNDEFIPLSKGGKLPDSLFDIINDEEKREKLIVYINPPYAEGGNSKTKVGTGDYKKSVNESKIHDKYHSKLSGANRELFAQFLARIYAEIPLSKIAEFSTLKILQSSNFSDFRNFYRAKLEKIFLAPADTFDNVRGQFPIGFKIWNSEINEKFIEIEADVYDRKANFTKTKNIYSYENDEYFSKWVNAIKRKTGFVIGWIEGTTRNSFQHNGIIQIINSKEQMAVPRGMYIYAENLIECSVCFAVRHCIEANWLNDRDQFLYPNDNWQSDTDFQNDCLVFTLFHGQNRISSQNNSPAEALRNHWLPFTESEVNASERFESHFMTDFISGKITNVGANYNSPSTAQMTLFHTPQDRANHNLPLHNTPLKFSEEATAVFDAGRELWKYYHTQPNTNPNASLYDIREHFQGRSVAPTGKKGRMNNKSDDEKYNELIGNLRDKLKILAEKIQPKVFEYGFLKS